MSERGHEAKDGLVPFFGTLALSGSDTASQHLEHLW